MFTKALALIAGVALGVVLLVPEPASARVGGFGGFRGGGFGGFRGAGIGGFRGGAFGFRGAGLGWRGAGWRPGWGGWGWRRGWGWGAGAAVIGAGIAAGSFYDYPYGAYPVGYGYGGYGYGGYGYGGGCVLQQQVVVTAWGYQPTLVRVCY
jgi:hypothetical protein